MLPGLYPYLTSLAPPGHPVLDEMERFGARRRFPLIGPLVGRLLLQLATISGARRVLELGSGFGYSAAWFLLAHPELRVTCSDMSSMNRDRAHAFLERLGALDRVDFRVADGISVARELDGPFDIVFCDLDKRRYLEAFEASVGKLRSGGMFVADNSLWRGYSWHPAADDQPEFRREAIPGVRAFNAAAHRHPDVITTIIPLRDGISLSVRR